MIAKFYTNAMYIVMLLTLGSILLSIFASPELAKASFIGATSLSAGLFTLGMVFIGRQKAEGNKYMEPFNFNVWIVGVCILAVLASVFSFQDVSVFMDSVFENVVAGTMSSGVALALGFAKRSEE